MTAKLPEELQITVPPGELSHSPPSVLYVEHVDHVLHPAEPSRGEYVKPGLRRY